MEGCSRQPGTLEPLETGRQEGPSPELGWGGPGAASPSTPGAQPVMLISDLWPLDRGRISFCRGSHSTGVSCPGSHRTPTCQEISQLFGGQRMSGRNLGLVARPAAPHTHMPCTGEGRR